MRAKILTHQRNRQHVVSIHAWRRVGEGRRCWRRGRV